MIVCPACKHRNPEAAPKCEACDGSLEHFVYRVCPSCGVLNPAQNTFCHRCFSELVPHEEEASTTMEKASGAAVITPLPLAELPKARVSADEIPLTEQVEPTTTFPVENQASLAQSEEQSAPPAAEHGSPIAEGGAADLETPRGASNEVELTLTGEELPAQGPIRAETDTGEEQEAIVSEVEEAPEKPASEGEEPSGVATAQALASQEQAEVLPEVTASPLEGIDSPLPLESVVALPHRAVPPPTQEVSETDQYDAELFRQIASARASLHEPMRIVALPRGKLLPRIGRTLLYLLVLCAALVPLFSGEQTASWVRPREAVTALARTLDEIPAQATILISFDYGPTYAGEMDPLATEVIRHLAARSVHMVVISTRPEGLGLAEEIYDAIARELPDYRYGEQYAILGYLPGQEAGLRTLNSALDGAFKTDDIQRRALSDMAVTRGLATLKDLNQVIVLADDSQYVRRWIEQVQSRSDITLDALVTAGIEPLLIPYRQSGQLHNLVAAATGTAEYEVASRAQPLALRQTDAYAALFVLLVLVALVANIVYLSQGKPDRRQEL
jgi:hypothetical protein